MIAPILKPSLVLHNADARYDSSTSSWNLSKRNESNEYIELSSCYGNNDKESSTAGTDNRPPMLEESDFESWKIRIERYIRGKPLEKLIWKSIKNGPTPHPMITVTTGEGEQQTQETREKTDEEFTEAESNKEPEIPVNQRNTKFLNNLPSYWGNYEQHAMKTLSKMNQTSRNADPLAYMAQATQSTSSHSQYVPLPP
ncbi:hypothetical protein Tco_1556041 [Tanacetum coccineum]